jgi:hypothetical protein
MSPRRVKPRAPKRAPETPTPGQLSLDGADPWQPTGCDCWPPVPRGCGHCKTCETCQDCHRCAGQGCTCEC